MRFIDLFAGIGGFHYGLQKVELENNRVEGINRKGTTKTHFERSKKNNEEKRLNYGLSSIKTETQRVRQEDTQRVRGEENGSKNEGHEGLDSSRPAAQQHPNRIADRQFTCVYSNEWDKYANSVYRAHFGECDNRDIRTVDASEIPDHDLLCGGFPCQSFSIAGKRGGFNDTRGTLFFDIARILKAKQPRLCLLENVKGLLSHDAGRTFKTIIATLIELGYDCQWQVLNSKDFGVPQNRERVFIIGHLRGTRRPKVFPIGEGSEENYGKKQIVSIAIDSNYWKGADKHGQRTMIEITQNVSDAQRIYDSNGIAKTLKGLGGGMGAKTGLYFVGGVGEPNRLRDGKKLSRNYKQGYRIYDSSGIANTIPSQSVGGLGGATGLYLTHTNKSGNTTFNNYAMALRSGASANYQTVSVVRRLTPVECERLQGFPDNWTQYGVDGELISDTQRYKMCGNAVTTNVITAIAYKIWN